MTRDISTQKLTYNRQKSIFQEIIFFGDIPDIPPALYTLGSSVNLLQRILEAILEVLFHVMGFPILFSTL